MIVLNRPELPNPKQRRGKTGRSSWFAFYPGFSFDFAVQAISGAKLDSHATVLDPWNGGGTTTLAAKSLGLDSIGIDLNPVMMVAAKARALSIRHESSLVPIGRDILKEASKITCRASKGDPLTTWFVPASVSGFRALDHAIRRRFINECDPIDLATPVAVTELSGLAAFYYVALFRTIRVFLRPFIPSNPTWTKRPRSLAARLRPQPEKVWERYRFEIDTMASSLNSVTKALASDAVIDLHVGSSTALPLADDSVDFVLASPPYCTRIDYAVATMPELAILGYHPDLGVDQLRRELIGTSTVPSQVGGVDTRWGQTCISFLRDVLDHDSKASSTYYYKNHYQYFSRIFASLAELKRVLRVGSRCVIVVQDSYYKDIHNNLPRIIQEMLEGLGFVLEDRIDYNADFLMAHLHPGTRMYRSRRRATESVLCLRRLERWRTE